jgi:GTPase
MIISYPLLCCACRIAEIAAAEGKALVLVLNKWDKVKDRSSTAMKTTEESVKDQLRHVSWAKCVFTSAIQGTTSWNDLAYNL